MSKQDKPGIPIPPIKDADRWNTYDPFQWAPVPFPEENDE